VALGWRRDGGGWDDCAGGRGERASATVAVGCACGHPYLLCNDFTFGNSDGSSDWTPPDASLLVAGAAGAAQVIDLLCTLAHITLFEQVH
jgi:hypothetical protein